MRRIALHPPHPLLLLLPPLSLASLYVLLTLSVFCSSGVGAFADTSPLKASCLRVAIAAEIERENVEMRRIPDEEHVAALVRARSPRFPPLFLARSLLNRARF